MIELTHASFQYENSDRGVQDISILVKSGECVVLTGLSGCGKTTVTRLVNGLAPSYYPGAFSGSVRIDGKDISRLSTWEIGRLVGSVFQDPKSQFFSSELAGEVAFPCENYGLSAREIRERTDAAIEALGYCFFSYPVIYSFYSERRHYFCRIQYRTIYFLIFIFYFKPIFSECWVKKCMAWFF